MFSGKVRRVVVLIISCVLFLVMFAGYMLGTTDGAGLILLRVLSPYAVSEDVSWDRISGSVFQGFAVKDMALKNVRFFPPGTTARIQEIDLHLKAPRLSGLESVLTNARLVLPDAGPVVMDARSEGWHFKANIYALAFSLSSLKDFFPGDRALSFLKGDLRKVNLYLDGVPGDFRVYGDLVLDRFEHDGYVLEDCPLKIDLRLKEEHGQWRVFGKVLVRSGTFRTPKIKVDIDPGQVYFSGDVTAPEFDLEGHARVARVAIHIVIRGTRKDPEVVLSSDPVLPHEQILLLLATGRKWAGMSAASSGKPMSPELAGDFVDYFLFGGPGKKLAQYLGLSDISFSMKPNTQGVMVNKDVTDSIGVGYGVEVTSRPNEPKELKQTVQGEYDVNNNITVGVQKEITGTLDPALKGQVEPPPPDDRVYMKYKTSF